MAYIQSACAHPPTHTTLTVVTWALTFTFSPSVLSYTVTNIFYIYQLTPSSLCVNVEQLGIPQCISAWASAERTYFKHSTCIHSRSSKVSAGKLSVEKRSVFHLTGRCQRGFKCALVESQQYGSFCFCPISSKWLKCNKRRYMLDFAFKCCLVQSAQCIYHLGGVGGGRGAGGTYSAVLRFLWRSGARLQGINPGGQSLGSPSIYLRKPLRRQIKCQLLLIGAL